MIEGCGVPHAQSTVRPATPRDITAVATLHIAAIHEGFLSTLGVRFLRRLYARILASPHGFLVVADAGGGGDRPPIGATVSGRSDGNGVIGFIAGATSVERLYRQFLWRDGAMAMLSSAPQLARSLPEVFETLRYGTGSPAGAGPDRPQLPEAELLAMAVAAASRRRGTGGALVNAFVSTAARSRAASGRVVVSATNQEAIDLYRRAGFTVDSQLELHSGTRSLLMRADLSPPAGP